MFRVYSPKETKFVYFDFYNVPINLVSSVEWPVQRFTGLYDRKKNPIYEGDILNCFEAKYESTKISENVYFSDTSKPVLQGDVFCYKSLVNWSDYFCGFRLEFLDKREDWKGGSSSCALKDKDFIYEVIGNSIENEIEYSNNV